MHGQAIHLLAPVRPRPGHARHALKQGEAGRMPRRGDRRIGGLPGAHGDFRLRPLHHRRYFRLFAPDLCGDRSAPIAKRENAGEETSNICDW